MLLASKVGLSGVALILLATGISRPGPKPLAVGANLSQEVSAVDPRNDLKKLQKTLRDNGHYRGEVDGVIGLRTRAGIRAYQTAENLPATGRLDAQTAGKLGVREESREDTRNEITQVRPSAGIKWAKGSGRYNKTPRKAIKAVVISESDREDAEKPQQAEGDNHPH